MTTWQETVASAAFLAAVAAEGRLISGRLALVDREGNEIQDLTGVDSFTVTYSGESAESWALDVTITDPQWVPRKPTDALAPTSGYRIKAWWRIWSVSDWLEVPMGVYHPTKPQVRTSSEQTTISLTGRDPVAQAKRSGWAGTVLNVGGLTVSAALEAILYRIAPNLPYRVETSTVTLPAVMTLGSEPPWDNVTEIAAVGGLTVRADRDGVIVAASTISPTVAKLDLHEGPDCVVLEIDRDIDTDTKNVWTATSTNSELTAPISATVQCDDPASPYFIGSYGPFTGEIESDKIDTVTAAANMARAAYEQNLRPTETVTVTIPQRADLEYRDLAQVAIEDAGVAGSYRVSSWRLVVGSGDRGPAPMTVTFMTTQGA